MAIHERLWDCDYCQTKRVKGRNKFCPHCGGQRPDNVVFYKNTEEDDVVTDPALLALANDGPDRKCPHCQQDNGGSAKFCGFCGGVMDGSPARKVVVQKLNEIPTSGDIIPTKSRDEEATSSYTPNPRLRPTSAKSFATLHQEGFNWSSWIVPGAVVLVVIALITFFAIWFQTRTVEIVPTGFSWSRSIEIQIFKEITESGWTTPTDARNTRSVKKFHHNDRVEDGTEPYDVVTSKQVADGTEKCGETDLGNGFSKDVYCPKYKTVTETKTEYRTKYKDVPVEKDWYTYEVDRWVFSRSIDTSGADQKPLWGTFVLGPKERESGRTERYTASFGSPDGKIDYKSLDLDQSIWSTLRLKQKIKAQVNPFNVLLRLGEK